MYFGGTWNKVRYDASIFQECVEALRALVGPPSWEQQTEAVESGTPLIQPRHSACNDHPVPPLSAEAQAAYNEDLRELVRSGHIRVPTTEPKSVAEQEPQAPAPTPTVRGPAEIWEYCDKVAALTAERDQWITDFRELNYRATRLQSEVDDLRRQATDATEHNDAVHDALDHVAEVVNTGQPAILEAVADLMRIIDPAHNSVADYVGQLATEDADDEIELVCRLARELGHATGRRIAKVRVKWSVTPMSAEYELDLEPDTEPLPVG